MPEIHQDVTDISSTSQLLRFALAGQLGQLRRQSGDLTQTKVAQAARLGGNPRGGASIISRALREGPAPDQLHKLDEVIGALASDRHGTGGLSSLALRLATEGHAKLNDSLIARVPPSWTGRILKNHPSSELEVLVQSSALLSAFMAADRVDNGSAVATIRERYAAEMRFLVPRLVLISVAPPTPGNYDAQILLGNLAAYAFDSMRDWLESGVRRSPFAFRVWPAITKLVKLRGNGAHAEELKGWVFQLLRDSAELRKASLYAGRSLDLELALVVPPSWSPARDDWASDVLLTRAWEKEATIRERGTAAMGLWQRALEHGRDLKATEDSLRKLIAEFRHPDSRPDAAAGLRWVAATLEQVIDQRERVCNLWPDVDEPWYHNVHLAAATLDQSGIPEHLCAGSKNLFLNMVLQNAGVYRRHAIETAVTSGWSRQIATALGYLLRNEKDEAWLRVRAEFALGFLQRPNQWVEDDLTRACLDAYKNLGLDRIPDDKAPDRARVTEVHTALFAVGDCFGAAGAEERVRSARDRVRPVLTALASATGDRANMLRRAARAAAYLLTVTAQPRENGQEDLSETLLRKLSSHPDDITARLSRWTLSFRFAPDGTVRPLLDAVDHGAPYDAP